MQRSYTYSAHPVGAAAAIACLEETARLNVKDNAAVRGTELFDGCLALMEKHAIIGDVRGGHGLMTALELVVDRSSKTPADKETVSRIFERSYEAGVMIRVSGPNVILSPPLVLTAADVQTILRALDDALSS